MAVVTRVAEGDTTQDRHRVSEQGRRDREVELANGIVGWRRGSALADYACWCASHGERDQALAWVKRAEEIVKELERDPNEQGWRRDLITTQYAPQVVSHPRELERHLTASLAQIDAVQSLAERIAAVPREVGRVPTDTAFDLWRQTDLAAARLTSAVELYAQDGPQVSRFGFNFPEYQATVREWRSAVCSTIAPPCENPASTILRMPRCLSAAILCSTSPWEARIPASSSGPPPNW